MHESVISQYIVQNDSDQPTTTGKLCDSIAAENDTLADLMNYYKAAWDIHTAVGVWLDYWGIWVGIGRYLFIPVTDEYFGFATDSGTFNHSVFFSTSQEGQTFRLDDSSYRQLILLKAFSNISGCAIPVLNQCLQMMFAGRGRCYARDNFDMTVTLVFEFVLYDWEYAVLTQSNAFPKPAGVRINLELFTGDQYFGFAADSGTFNNSVFKGDAAPAMEWDEAGLKWNDPLLTWG